MNRDQKSAKTIRKKSDGKGEHEQPNVETGARRGADEVKPGVVVTEEGVGHDSSAEQSETLAAFLHKSTLDVTGRHSETGHALGRQRRNDQAEVRVVELQCVAQRLELAETVTRGHSLTINSHVYGEIHVRLGHHAALVELGFTAQYAALLHILRA